MILHTVFRVPSIAALQCIRSISLYCCNCQLARNQNAKTKAQQEHENFALIRNIGILAHIDAGKTTTTERMLYYSGKISSMGEVHHGNTVTDYLQQERARGITITSAAVAFPWCDHFFNLVDTPGHIDFTVEVEHTLSVLDGAVVVLDASAGVEAQTSTVWQQADRYHIPRIVYANKMDRADASIELCAETLRSKLGAEVLQLHLPVIVDNHFCGLVDLLQMQKSIWKKETSSGTQFDATPLTEDDGSLWATALEARESLTDQLAMLDDVLAEQVLEVGSLSKVPPQALVSTVRRVTILEKAVPLLCGSSYRNIGVQPLMDAVVRYLPSPLERRNRRLQDSFGSELCARAFKTIHHAHLGPLVFFRLFSGKIKQGDKIFNTRLEKTEQAAKVLSATADETEDVKEVTKGNIAVLAGLKDTMTGDLICESSSSLIKAKRKMMKLFGVSEEEASRELGVGSKVPDPVFFCTVEPYSQVHQGALDTALSKLQREDPSLRVFQNDQTGQIELGGMGELHIDIIRDRILTEHKVKASLGPLQIVYKETLLNTITETLIADQLIGGSKQTCEISLTLVPELKTPTHQTLVKLDKSEGAVEHIRTLKNTDVAMVRDGVKRAFSHGPKLGGEVVKLSVVLHRLTKGKNTSESIIVTAVSRCVLQALKRGNMRLLEPIMRLEIVVPHELVNAVMGDLNRRRADLKEAGARGNNQVLLVDAPLSELLGYSNSLRIVTSGKASFTMEYLRHQEMTPDSEAEAIKKETGFYPLDYSN